MGIRIGGCASTRFVRNYVHKFSVNENCYFCSTARRRGILEKVTIREVMDKFVMGNVMSPAIMYMDTNNAYYNENELCTRDEAIALADAHRAAKLAFRQSELVKQACLPAE